MPIRDILVRDARGHVEHDDATLPLDVISVSEATKFLLPGGVPNIEADCSEIGVESQGVNFDSQSCWIA